MYNGKPDPYIVPCLKAKAGGTKKQMTEFMSAKLRKKIPRKLSQIENSNIEGQTYYKKFHAQLN